MERTCNLGLLRQKLLKLLGPEHADLYPAETEKHFPHIVQRIADFWHEPELDRYFETLMTTERVDRHGFSEAVATEIFRLSNHHADFGLSDRGKSPWEAAPDPDLSRKL